MSWTAVVPLKGGPSRKSRLAPALDAQTRAALSDAMARHVLTLLAACAAVEEVLLLSPEPPAWPGVGWRSDAGRGLNAELARLCADRPASDLLIVHADLPLLTLEEVEGLLRSGGKVAIAPDHHGVGTNAVAVRAGRPFAFSFGPDSFGRHRAAAPDAAVVERPGLQLDVDTPEDLAVARRAGFAFEVPRRIS